MRGAGVSKTARIGNRSSTLSRSDPIYASSALPSHYDVPRGQRNLKERRTSLASRKDAKIAERSKNMVNNKSNLLLKNKDV